VYVCVLVPLENLKEKRTQDDISILDVEDGMESLAAYYADGNKERDREPVYNDELGLAVESLPQGYDVSALWLLY